jgi:predicted Zn-dependent protease
MRFSLRALTATIAVLTAVSVAAPALAYNYAGYRWSGYWPSVPVDTSQIYLNAWRDSIGRAMGDWNNAGARFTFTGGSSSNKIYTAYEPGSSALATTYVSRQWWGGGDVSRATVKINNYYTFNPPYGIDLATVMRHEFGHWLVLHHTAPVSLMQPTYGGVKYLGYDDVVAIRSIYGNR